MTKRYIAVDLGASSGRVIVGTLENGSLSLEEVARFWNGPTDVRGTFHWDVLHLFRNIQEGIAKARKLYGDEIVSIGVDTWGVDFGLMDSDGNLLGNPVHYRDSRTDGMMDEAFSKVPREEMFACTGIQFMQLNSVFQLVALVKENSEQFQQADKLLFIPDLLNYWLTGNMVAERSIASTSQCYNPLTGDWAHDMLKSLGIDSGLFADLVDPGTVIGECEGIPVVAVGGHDTASAFAAVPVEQGENAAFLSSGTWSLLGAELAEPMVSEEALAANFTNEVGVCDTIRFLKNITGLWTIQELQREWKSNGHDYSWSEIGDMAKEGVTRGFCIDPSDPVFVAPGDMEERVKNYCAQNGQGTPSSHAEVAGAVYQGLATLYASVLSELGELCGREFDTLRIVGGGCKAQLLNQMAANSTGCRVVTGPEEATCIGNFLVQMLATGEITSLEEGRALVRKSFADETKVFSPES